MNQNILVMKYFFFLFLATILFSCNKSDNDCNDVEYDQSFTIEEGIKYCFSDGNSLIVEELENAFCPCDVICVWEGEMIFHYKVNINNTEYSGIVGSSNNTDNLLGIEPFTMQTIEIEFEVPCSESVPSPKILSAEVRVLNQ